MKKRILSLILALAMCLTAFVGVFAKTAATYEARECSLSIVFEYDDEALEGIEVSITKIASIDGIYGETDLTELDTEEMLSLATEIADTVTEYDMTAVTDADGTAYFESITEYGYYVVIQTGTIDGYEAITPYILDIPHLEDGEYEYDITAYPKTSIVKAEEETTTETTTEETTETTESDDDLAQTGDNTNLSLWFTVAAIAVLVCLIIFIKRKKREE